jgi:hypothetical protein
MNKPFCLSFNIAVRTIAARLFPCGYDVAEAAPNSLDELNAHIAETGRMLVYSGASDSTIYACPETNYAFRAWHDWCHWKGQHPFTIAGERAVMQMQRDHLRTVYGPTHRELCIWDAILEAEIMAQAERHESTGAFPVDQRTFVEELVAEIMQRNPVTRLRGLGALAWAA